MKNTFVTRFDRELLDQARQFVSGVAKDAVIRTALERFGLENSERARGAALVADTERSLEWEADGKAWNFLSHDKEGRVREAIHWFKDGRRRYVRSCVRAAEERAGWAGCGPETQWPLSKKLTVGLVIAFFHLVRALSPREYLRDRVDLKKNLKLAFGERPEGAPSPKDTALVELSAWYERWKLVAQRVFRQAPALLNKLGLKPGKAPPRLRTAEGRAQYGEGFFKVDEPHTGCDQMAPAPA